MHVIASLKQNNIHQQKHKYYNFYIFTALKSRRENFEFRKRRENAVGRLPRRRTSTGALPSTNHRPVSAPRENETDASGKATRQKEMEVTHVFISCTRNMMHRVVSVSVTVRFIYVFSFFC